MSPTAAPSPAVTPHAQPPRLMSLDAFRGAIMVFLVSVALGFKEISRSFPDSGFWQFLAYHSDHTAWVGGGAWDMIQAAFMFMVGVALPFSYASRQAKGVSLASQLGHALRRSLVLVLIAVLIASRASERTVFIFTNVLGQIGLGYLLVFFLTGRGWKLQLGALAAIAVGYWLLFALYPVPGAGFDYGSVGVKPRELKDVVLPGFFAHWNSQTNVAAVFDRWFLNLFPTAKPFVFNPGGYETLNFVPSLITMILGLMTGEKLRRDDPQRGKMVWMLTVGAGCLVLGLLAGSTVCPIVKRIWTPSWALYSGGIVLWMLAAFYFVIDIQEWRKWASPLVVVGMNSIAIYLMDIFLRRWVVDTFKKHLGSDFFHGTFGIMWQYCAVLLVFWLVCWWMYRRKMFLRI